MVEFNFKSQRATTIEQSERLLALGLKKETADCYDWQETEPMYGEAAGVWHLETLDSHDNQEHFEYLDKYFGVCLADDEEHYFIPAWSLHRLIEMMPQSIYHKSLACFLFIDQSRYVEYRCSLYGASQTIVEQFMKSNLWENLINCIEWLIKEGYFNKEYLV